MDMVLAFIAEVAGNNIAGNIQLDTEYYPEQILYPNDYGELPSYVNHLE